MGEWDVLLKDEPTEEESRAAGEAARTKAQQRVLALEQKLREGAEDSMDVLASKLNTELDIQRKVTEAQQAAATHAEAPPTPWVAAADVLPELQRDGDAVAGNDSDDEWQEEKMDATPDLDATPGCRVELMCSMSTIRSRLRRSSETDASFFSLPPMNKGNAVKMNRGRAGAALRWCTREFRNQTVPATWPKTRKRRRIWSLIGTP